MCAANSWTTETWMPYLFRSLLFVLYFSRAPHPPHELFGRLWSVVLIDSNVGDEIHTVIPSRRALAVEFLILMSTQTYRKCFWRACGLVLAVGKREHTPLWLRKLNEMDRWERGGKRAGRILKVESTTCVTRKNVEQKKEIPLLWVFAFYSIILYFFSHAKPTNDAMAKKCRKHIALFPDFCAFASQRLSNAPIKDVMSCEN